MKISGIVNTYNEEENIYDCLESIRWVDELIVVDMYSTDKTIELVNQFTNKVIFHTYTGYVEKARNFAIKKARGEWILILDADERLDKKDEMVIRNLVLQKNIDGYWFARKNYINEKYYLRYGYFYPDYQLRLFRNKESIYYSEKIHEQPNIATERIQKIVDINIIHNPSHSKYSSLSAFKNFIPYIKIEGEDLSNKKVSFFKLILQGPLIVTRNFYRCYIKLKGYKDGYYGFRAALLYAIYKGSIYYYAVIKRIIKKL